MITRLTESQDAMLEERRKWQPPAQPCTIEETGLGF